MKTKFIEADYDREIGTSIVTLKNELGVFVGYANLNPEDKEYESELTGCTIAELHARQDIYRMRIDNLKQQKLGVTRLANMLTQTREIAECDKFYKIDKQMYKMGKIIDAEIAIWKNKITQIDNQITEICEANIKSHKALNKIK